MPLPRDIQHAWFMFKTVVNLVRRGQFTEMRDRTYQKVLGYRAWYRKYSRLSAEDRRLIRRHIEKMSGAPKISILLPTYNTPEAWLRAAIDSVITQLYPYWELCIADDSSTDPSVRRILSEYAARDPRVKVIHRPANGHISAATNSAIKIASGEFLAFLDHDDTLAEHALYCVAAELEKHPCTELIYSDEDKIDESGRHFDPFFKPDWSPDLLRSMNYINHLTVIKAERVRALGGLRTGFEGSQDYDLLLRATERLDRSKIRHIPEVLYHWRAIPGSVALASDQKNYAHERARKALKEHLERTGVRAVVEEGFGGYHRVRYLLPETPPLVSLVIGTRDRVQLLRGVCEGLLEKTSYRNFELVIIDNGSVEPETLSYLGELPRRDERVRVIRHAAPFNFSEINNRGVRESRGSVIGLLNNDLEVIEPGWLEEMVSQALRPEVGAVGARLLYADRKLQHAGVITGIGLVAGHSHKFLPAEQGGYLSRTKVVCNYSAVTAACLLMRREVFAEVGGLDAQNLAVAFNDVDLCLKVREKGYSIVFTPYAELFHLESASRGSDMTAAARPRFMREQDFMLRKWGATLPCDPYYSPNLTERAENFAIAFPPRLERPWRNT